MGMGKREKASGKWRKKSVTAKRKEAKGKGY